MAQHEKDAQQPPYGARRELFVLAYGCLFLFGGLGVVSLVPWVANGFSNPKDRLLALFGGLTGVFFTVISLKLLRDIRPQFTIELDYLRVLIRGKSKIYPWKDFLGHESLRPAVGEYKMRFQTGEVGIAFYNLKYGSELRERIDHKLAELGRSAQTAPPDIVSRLEARWVLLGCMMLINILPIAALPDEMKSHKIGDFVSLLTFAGIDVFLMALISRQLTLRAGVLRKRWLIWQKSIVLSEATKIILLETQGRGGRYEETMVESHGQKITFTSADTHYLALRDQVLKLSRQAELSDNRGMAKAPRAIMKHSNKPDKSCRETSVESK